jgi:hypothetical protein
LRARARMAFLSLRASVMTSFLPSHDPQPPPAESVTSKNEGS